MLLYKLVGTAMRPGRQLHVIHELHVDGYIYVFRRGYINMGVICYASDNIEYDRRILELSNAPLHIK